ncbi:MAG: transglycosylase SLT domain-containing protein [Deltaproteobacteria bacterium]|nr:transglycosylase SLT domain-containing protein [Deltaproteobacteria bacterium]
MSRRPAPKSRARGPRRRRTRRSRGPVALLKQLPKKLPSRKTRRRWWRAWHRLPDAAQWPLGLAAVALLLVAVNVVYQVARKPTELYYPIEDSFHKTHEETWRAYGHLFRRHSTAIIAPEFLAALAQTESAGNPVVRTYWRFAWTGNPFSLYRPASSAVGMFQIIDGTFDEASRYCIHDHRVVETGPWHDLKSCWFNALYFRTIPSHAIELTAAHLHTHVERALRRHPVRGATVRQKQELAALIHLCGAGAGQAHARRGLRLVPGLRCGSHETYRYIAKVRMAQARFAALAARD